MTEMMASLEKQQELTVAQSAGTFRVEQLVLRGVQPTPDISGYAGRLRAGRLSGAGYCRAIHKPAR